MTSRIYLKATSEEIVTLFEMPNIVNIRCYERHSDTTYKVIIRHCELDKPLSGTFTVIGNTISLGVIYVLTKTCSPSLVVLALTLAAMPVFVTLIASLILFCGKFKSVAPSLSYVDRKYIKDLFGLGYKFFIIIF